MHYMNDFYELAMLVCGLDPDDDDQFEEGEDKVDEILYEKYNIDSEQFEAIAKALIPFAGIGKSELTGETYIGFTNHEKGLWIYKEKIKQ